MSEQLEGRNPVLECLARGRRAVRKIFLDPGALQGGKGRGKPDRRVQRIVELARAQGVPLVSMERRQLDELAGGRVHNGVVASVDPLPRWTTANVLDATFEAGRSPFLVLPSELAYEHNLGAVLRSALGFGVDGVVLPTRRGAGLSPVVQRVSMGAVEVVPVVRESMHSALKHAKRAGLPIVAADMHGTPAHQLDLSGPLALVLGAEGAGVPKGVRDKADALVSIPLAGRLESLNVSVAAAVLMYEKRRQDGWFDGERRE